MRRATFKGSFLYVEGQSDEKLYGMFIDPGRCQIVVGHTRSNVVEACRILETDQFVGAIGIIDADFDHLEGRVPDIASIFQTDLHDGECLMLSSPAFHKLLFQFASQDKLHAMQTSHATDIRGYLLCQAAIIGSLVWYSNREQLNLSFETLEVKEYADALTLKVDLQQFVGHVKNKSSRPAIPDEQLIGGLQQGLALANDLWQVTRGHDYIDVLSFALRKALGSWAALEVTRERLELCLRLAYSEDDFSRTHLFSQVSAWEALHVPFQVFREPRQQKLEV